MKRAACCIILLIIAGIITGLFKAEPAVQTAFNGQKPVVVIDAGHGGFDGGAVGRVTGVKEDGLNLSVSKLLKIQFRKAGYGVVMTRGDGGALAETKNADMARRRDIISESKADMVISVHMNKFGDPAVHGPQVFYFSESDEGETLAKLIQRELNSALNPPRPRVHKGESYFILKSGECPCVIVECGFLSNEREERLLQTESYQLQCAKAIFAGSNAYMEQLQTGAGAEIPQ
ncbi:MAG: N-acetylmuramoyl-L-alanine amidase [Christensenellales bacterium]